MRSSEGEGARSSKGEGARSSEAARARARTAVRVPPPLRAVRRLVTRHPPQGYGYGKGLRNRTLTRTRRYPWGKPPGISKPVPDPTHTMTLCLPDLNVGTKHSFRYLSPGFLHTVASLDTFPTSTELSSVQMIRIQSSLVNCIASFAHAFLFRM